MKYRKLGLNNFLCSELGFGGAAISGEGKGYGMGPISEALAIDLIYFACDLGINLFDTAPIYGFTLSEKRLGKAFRASPERREKSKIISKCGVTWDIHGRVDMNNSPIIAEKMLNQSLKDLQTEQIDYYMIHWPDPKIDIRFPMEFLAKAKEQGKISEIGLCNTNLSDLEKAMEISPIGLVQSELNLFSKKSIEEIFPFLEERGISFISWGTLDKGILSGRVRSNEQKFHPEDARSWAPWWKKEKKQREEKFLKVKELEKKGNLLDLSLGHNLRFSLVKSVLCGGRNKEQLEELVSVVDRGFYKEKASSFWDELL